MEFVIAIVLGALAWPFVRLLDQSSREAKRNKLSNGGHLVLLDESLSIAQIKQSLYTQDPALAPDAVERLLWDAERKHLEAHVRELRSQLAETGGELGGDQGGETGTASNTAREDSFTKEFHAQEYAITFKTDEPRTFATFSGQEHIVRPLSAAIAALQPTDRVPNHTLFTGLPGRGKTLLAKVIGHELQLRAQTLGLPPLAFFETFASNLDSIDELDAVATALREADGGVWFIDEIHVLKHELSTKIFALMEDRKYPFHGSVSPTPMPPVMVIGATTDYGKLHPALKRRFGEPYMVRPMSQQALLTLVTHRTFPITVDAAQRLVDRTHWSGAPYEALSLRSQAEVFARAAGRKQITLKDVEEVFQVFEIDSLGLRWMDREVLRTLFKTPRFKKGGAEFVCYAASERDLCAMAGLDPDEYRESIKPRLLARRLLEIRSGYGQALTEHGRELYHSLLASD